MGAPDRDIAQAKDFIAPPGYRRHRPEATLLYWLVAEHYAGFRGRRAAEGRPKTAILLAGVLHDTGQPESSAVNYAPSINMPFLILVGRYDKILDYESSAKPLFDLIATPEDDKLMEVYVTDHIPPKSGYIAKILRWLDLYLGPVERQNGGVEPT